MLLLPIFLRPVQPCRFGPQSTRILGLEENALFVVVICSEVASSDADVEARPSVVAFARHELHDPDAPKLPEYVRRMGELGLIGDPVNRASRVDIG
jgi:hypothetical protein